MISQKHLEKFKELFKRKYGVEYSDDEAKEAVQNLVSYFELLISIDKHNKQKEHEKKQENKD